MVTATTTNAGGTHSRGTTQLPPLTTTIAPTSSTEGRPSATDRPSTMATTKTMSVQERQAKEAEEEQRIVAALKEENARMTGGEDRHTEIPHPYPCVILHPCPLRRCVKRRKCPHDRWRRQRYLTLAPLLHLCPLR